MQVFVAVALPSLAYREASDYNADLEGTAFSSLFLVAYFHCTEFASIPFVFYGLLRNERSGKRVSHTQLGVYFRVCGGL